MWNEIEKFLNSINQVEKVIQQQVKQIDKIDSVLDGCQQIQKCYEEIITSKKVQSEDPEILSRVNVNNQCTSDQFIQCSSGSSQHKSHNKKRKSKTIKSKHKLFNKSSQDPGGCVSSESHINNHRYLSFDHQLNGRMVINTYYDEKQSRFSPTAA